MTLGFPDFLKNERLKLLTDKRAFYDALGEAAPVAIRLLSEKIEYDIRQAARRAGLAVQDAEELVDDALVITISNVQNGTFLFSDFSPAAYAKGVARKLLANRIRAKKPQHLELEDRQIASDFDPETYLNDKELEQTIGKLLGKLGENCRQLLQLKYFENLRDRDIVEQGLTIYTSTTSLKSKRSQCMNQLVELAKETEIVR